MPGHVNLPFIEPTMTMRPLPRSRIWGSTSCASRTGPKTLVSNSARTRSIDTDSIAPTSWMPALLTSASMPSGTAATAAAIDSSLVTSSASVLQPLASRSAIDSVRRAVA